MKLKILLLHLIGMCAFIPNAMAISSQLILKPQTPIKVSTAPKRFDLMAVDKVRHRLLAAHSDAGTLTVINLNTLKQLAEIKVGHSKGVAIDTNNKKYFVGTNHGIAVVDPITLKKIGFIHTQGPTDAMIFDPGNKRLYVTHDDGKKLWVIDAQHDRITGSIAIPGAPELMEIDHRNHHLYLNIKTLDEVVTIDTNSNRIIAHWTTRQTHSPHGIALDQHKRRLFVAGHSPIVSVFSLPTGKPMKGIDIGPGRVDQIAYDAHAKRLYCPSSGRLVVVNVGDRSNTVVATVKIPKSAHSVAVDPLTHWVWISYADGNHSYVQAFAPQEK